MPGIAAAAVLPPRAGPGLGGHGHRLVLETVRRVARHDKELPGLLAGLCIEGGDEAPRPADLGTAIADQHLVPECLGRAGDVKRFVGVIGARAPDQFTALCVDREQPSVPGGGKNLALIKGDAAVVGPAYLPVLANVCGDVRIVLPEQLTSSRIHRADHVHRPDEIENAVDNQRR